MLDFRKIIHHKVFGYLVSMRVDYCVMRFGKFNPPAFREYYYQPWTRRTFWCRRWLYFLFRAFVHFRHWLLIVSADYFYMLKDFGKIKWEDDSYPEGPFYELKNEMKKARQRFNSAG